MLNNVTHGSTHALGRLRVTLLSNPRALRVVDNVLLFALYSALRPLLLSVNLFMFAEVVVLGIWKVWDELVCYLLRGEAQKLQQGSIWRVQPVQLLLSKRPRWERWVTVAIVTFAVSCRFQVQKLDALVDDSVPELLSACNLLVALLCEDLLQGVTHQIMHLSSNLWRTHRVHHLMGKELLRGGNNIFSELDWAIEFVGVTHFFWFLWLFGFRVTYAHLIIGIMFDSVGHSEVDGHAVYVGYPLLELLITSLGHQNSATFHRFHHVHVHSHYGTGLLYTPWLERRLKPLLLPVARWCDVRIERWENRAEAEDGGAGDETTPPCTSRYTSLQLFNSINYGVFCLAVSLVLRCTSFIPPYGQSADARTAATKVD